jgi:LPXTG-motif cell wall-anchored protein
MLKLLKYSVLALVLALGSSTFAHAETTATMDGGLLGTILSWLFPPPPSNNNHHGNTAPEIDPSLATSGLLLIGGTLVVTRRRRVNVR